MNRLAWIAALLLACLIGSRSNDLTRPGKRLHSPADWRSQAMLDSLTALRGELTDEQRAYLDAGGDR